jgi:AcrR family transcriptional regulator
MSAKLRERRKRPYRKRRRAEQEDETRRRITEAAVELHGSVGPASTTVSAVAEKAGVQRATVYRHFPDEASLFAACSTHWLAGNPLPDLDRWAGLGDPDARLRTALDELYLWFERGEYMVEKTTRDVAVTPALRPSMEQLGEWFEAASAVLLRGRPERGAARRRTRAAIGHAVAFETWRSLVRDQRLSRRQAVALMAGMVAGAQAPSTAPSSSS